MRSPTFLAASLVSFLSLLMGYVALVDIYLLSGREMPASYQQFLLVMSAQLQGKVVIDSGSNSRHGLDVEAVSDYFSAPVIVLADNAGVPLRKKILRLKRYLHPGDVLILPLEWDYFSRTEQLADVFLNGVAGNRPLYAHYLNELPLIERLQFILREYPLRYAAEAISAAPPDNRFGPYAPPEINRFRKLLSSASYEAWGVSSSDGPEPVHFTAAFSKSCDHYLFLRDDRPRLSVSDLFRRNLQLLRELQEEGVRVFIAWPAVVDGPRSACYEHPEFRDRVDVYAADVAGAVAAAGLPLIGDYRDSHFSSNCFLNTYYHIRRSCAPQRTAVLLRQLRDARVDAIAMRHNQRDLAEMLLDALDHGAPQTRR